jgi:hypothetical protein
LIILHTIPFLYVFIGLICLLRWGSPLKPPNHFLKLRLSGQRKWARRQRAPQGYPQGNPQVGAPTRAQGARVGRHYLCGAASNLPVFCGPQPKHREIVLAIRQASPAKDFLLRRAESG